VNVNDAQAAIYRGPRLDRYETPDWLWQPLHEQYSFSVDLAADAKNTKCPVYFCPEISFLASVGWIGTGWLNPPFSLAEPFCFKMAALAEQAQRAS
jgi:hypothetical protein